MRLLLLLTFSVLISGIGKTQDVIKLCNYTEGRSSWLKNYQLNPSSSKISSDIIWVNIQFHIVGDDQGKGYYDEHELRKIFCELNAFYAPASIQFYMEDDFNYINSTSAYLFNPVEEAYNVFSNAEFDFEDRISVFIVEHVEGACGIGSFDGGTFLALRKDCFGLGTKVLAHEIGHIFSMPHTFSDVLGQSEYDKPAPDSFEKLDGSNCSTAGDGFCDTKPDYVGVRWNCNNSNESDFTLRDPNNIEFKLDGTNIMSYSDDYCSDSFSEEQMNAMKAYINEELSYIVDVNYDQRIILPLSELTGVYPGNGDEVSLNNITLTWNEVPNVTNYVIELSQNETFDTLIYKETIEENQFTIDDNVLNENTAYYWRIGMYNLGYTCFSEYLESNSFIVSGDKTSTQIMNNIHSEYSIVPNPTSQYFNIMYSGNQTGKQNLEITIMCIDGKVVQNKSISIHSQKKIEVNIGNLENGVYLVCIKSSFSSHVKRLIVY